MSKIGKDATVLHFLGEKARLYRTFLTEKTSKGKMSTDE